MKLKNSRILLTAFALLGTATFGFGQATADQTYQPDSDRAGVMTQGQPVPQTSATNPTSGFRNWNLDTSGTTEVMVNQTPLAFSDALPGTIDGRLMIPVRAFAEQTGATVHWDNSTKQVEIDLPTQQTVTLTAIPMLNPPNYGTPRPTGDVDSDAGQNSVGGPYEPREPMPDMLSSSQVVIIDGHAYMPIEQLATAFEGSGSWNQNDGTATIILPDDVSPDMNRGAVNGVPNPPPSNTPEDGVMPADNDGQPDSTGP